MNYIKAFGYWRVCRKELYINRFTIHSVFNFEIDIVFETERDHILVGYDATITVLMINNKNRCHYKFKMATK